MWACSHCKKTAGLCDELPTSSLCKDCERTEKPFKCDCVDVECWHALETVDGENMNHKMCPRDARSFQAQSA
eukprot:165049-Karenia_brevis.AAC.1